MEHTVLTQAVIQVSRLKGFPRGACFSLTLNKLYGDWQRHGLHYRTRIFGSVSGSRHQCLTLFLCCLSVQVNTHQCTPTVLQPSDMPEMLIPLTSNRLVVFRHDLMKYSYRPAGDSLVIQTWLMSEPFAPNRLGERIVSLSAEIQGERLHIISLMTRLPGNSFGPLALLNVYAGGTDTVTRVPVERFDIDLYYMADKHEALGMGLSYTCHGAFCTENEVYHFDNVFFKIGEDEARLVSPSQRVLLETGYEALQRSGLIRASVGLALQAGALINSLVYLSAFR